MQKSACLSGVCIILRARDDSRLLTLKEREEEKMRFDSDVSRRAIEVIAPVRPPRAPAQSSRIAVRRHHDWHAQSFYRRFTLKYEEGGTP